jgi:hypothetical protein
VYCRERAGTACRHDSNCIREELYDRSPAICCFQPGCVEAKWINDRKYGLLASTSYELVQRPKPNYRGIEVTLGNHGVDIHKVHIELNWGAARSDEVEILQHLESEMIRALKLVQVIHLSA